MKKEIILSISLFLLCSTLIYSQTWSGSTTNSGLTYRFGNTAIGLSNSPNDTRLYVKSNIKVGIVSHVDHSIDFQYGIISAINRSNTKAFSVINTANSYQESFVVMGSGHVYASEITVKNIPVFPDYVFNENYNLLSLYAIEKYIKANNRLPKIPSANEIAEKGLSLGYMQVLQMEKIEELTLHMISLKKENDALLKTIEKLKSENEELRTDIEAIKAELNMN